MSRTRRVITDGVPYHITQRGNDKQDVFDSDYDRLRFLEHLEEQAVRYRLRLLSYCLMTNHVHLIIVPETQGAPLSTAMRGLFHAHALRMNFLRGAKGHFWEGRFHSCEMDRDHLYYAMRYVEQNPVRAGLIDRPEHWRWSTARYHFGTSPADCVIEDPEWKERFTPRQWREWMNSPQDAIVIDRLREATRTGGRFGAITALSRTSQR